MTAESFRAGYRLGIRRIAALTRRAKGLIMASVDAIAIPSIVIASAWLVGVSVVAGTAWTYSVALLLAAILAVVMMRVFGFYRSIVRFMGIELLLASLKSVTTLSALPVLWAVFAAVPFDLLVRHVIVFWALSLVYVVGGRAVARLALRSGHESGEPVLIYGAGDAGIRLAAAMLGRAGYSVVAFLDDDPALQGSMIQGFPVHPPAEIPRLLRDFRISKVLLALPSVSRRKRSAIIDDLEKFAVKVQTVPDLRDMIIGKAKVDDIRDVDIEDLLGRDVVAPIPELLGPQIEGRSVMITGAGGSIGSELCQQILQLRPARLILFEVSEAALYRIDRRLTDIRHRQQLDTEIVPLIGSVHHRPRVEEALRTYGVQTIYHAAAHKHVPMVEHNMLEGVHNNIFGTLHTAQAAVEAGVESFVLVSTDKAVNPTNVMGATKRFAELVLQALDETQSGTRFCIVRFGNVLASSGSVVPRFHEQIRAGGPVTVTHREVVRYFMTIPEAVSLVLQAASIATGGEVFVLDMGEPIRIADLAKRMIRLMGMTVCDSENPDGDIQIKFTGLRPGEKLYEELLIGDDVSGTINPRILTAREHHFSWLELEPMLDRLWTACLRQDCDRVRSLLLDGVAGYRPSADVEDLVWRQRMRNAESDIAILESNVRPIER